MTDFLKLLSEHCPGFKWAAFRIDFKDEEFQDLEFCEDSLGRDENTDDNEIVGPELAGGMLAEVLNEHKDDLIHEIVETLPDIENLNPKDRLYGIVCFVKHGPSKPDEVFAYPDSEDGECFFDVPASFSGMMAEVTYRAHIENQVSIS